MHTHAQRRAAAGLTLALALAFLTGDGDRAANEPQPVSGEMLLAHIEPETRKRGRSS